MRNVILKHRGALTYASTNVVNQAGSRRLNPLTFGTLPCMEELWRQLYKTRIDGHFGALHLAPFLSAIFVGTPLNFLHVSFTPMILFFLLVYY